MKWIKNSALDFAPYEVLREIHQNVRYPDNSDLYSLADDVETEASDLSYEYSNKEQENKKTYKKIFELVQKHSAALEKALSEFKQKELLSLEHTDDEYLAAIAEYVVEEIFEHLEIAHNERSEMSPEASSKWIEGFSREAVEVENSLPRFKDLIKKRYSKATWKTSATAKDYACKRLNGKSWALQAFISGLRHNAPIYEKSHPGCTCIVVVSGIRKKSIEIKAI